jgi:hypothetical protein
VSPYNFGSDTFAPRDVVRFVHKIRLAVVLTALLAAGFCIVGVTQDDPNDVPLGDVARKFRKSVPAPQQVIDDDNLSHVMDQAETRRAAGWPQRSLLAGEINNFRPAAPDVTCNLAFSMNAKALFSTQYAQMDLPATEVVKLAGPASVEGDALSVSVFNGTQWHVSEVSIAFTVVRKAGVETPLPETPIAESVAPPRMLPMPGTSAVPGRKSDLTVIYRIRAAAPPMSTTVFSAPLNLDLAADEEWHWAIVQARGYPPQEYLAQTPTSEDVPAAMPESPASISKAQR